MSCLARPIAARSRSRAVVISTLFLAAPRCDAATTEADGSQADINGVTLLQGTIREAAR